MRGRFSTMRTVPSMYPCSRSRCSQQPLKRTNHPLNSEPGIRPIDHEAVGWLLKSRTFVEIRPSLTYFMCSATDDLSGEQTGANIRGYGLTLQTYRKNLAAVEVGYKDIFQHYASNPDNAWEHYLERGDIVKWRINPLSPYRAEQEEARKAELVLREARSTGEGEVSIEQPQATMRAVNPRTTRR